MLRFGGARRRQPFPYGICLCEGRVTRGEIRTVVHFPDEVSEARILFGYDSEESSYYTAGLGGWQFAYTIQQYHPTLGWSGLKAAGEHENLRKTTDYEVVVKIHGNRVRLIVNEVAVLEHILGEPMTGDQIGVCTVGTAPVLFRGYQYAAEPGDAFVAMQFGEPFDSLYRDVIATITSEFGLRAYRADDVYGPGIILQDIVRGIVEAKLIIVEITPPNPNVFYELGFAHAIGKDTILLAERGADLPFDIRGYRVIFYENSIGGKKKVETALRKHLEAVVG